MYRAKLNGKNRYLVSEPGMQDAIHGRIELEMDLREAVANDDSTSSTSRFRPRRSDPDPHGGAAAVAPAGADNVSPDEFVPLLEDRG